MVVWGVVNLSLKKSFISLHWQIIIQIESELKILSTFSFFNLLNMKKIINFWKWTKSIEFMFKLFIAWIFNRIWVRNESAKWIRYAENILCKRPYIINTNFGSYIWNSMMAYFLLDEDYEPEINEVIRDCYQKNMKQGG